MSDERAVVIASDPCGAVLALRWFAPDAPTAIHGHGGWGAALVLEGRDRYERFEVRDGVAVLDATLWLERGDVAWWLDPPHDVHRQSGLDRGALQLVVVSTVPTASGDNVVPEADRLGGAGSLAAAVRDAYDAGSFGPLRHHYADDVIADVCVPAWRFQLRGRDALGDLLDREEFGLRGQRLHALRSFPMVDGCVVEVAARFEHGGETRQWRDVHILRTRGGEVVEHLAYCTGHWDAETIARQDAEAPMVRP